MVNKFYETKKSFEERGLSGDFFLFQMLTSFGNVVESQVFKTKLFCSLKVKLRNWKSERSFLTHDVNLCQPSLVLYLLL